jgi:hypothetical protein
LARHRDLGGDEAVVVAGVLGVERDDRCAAWR